MFLSAYLAICVTQFPVDLHAGENPLTQLSIKESPAGSSFDWSDAEETLRGTFGHGIVAGGTPITISATLEPRDGPDFEGPLSISIRPISSMGAALTQTVSRTKAQKAWLATFEPQDPGEYRLEISWRSTAHKVVRGTFPVREAGLPSWFRYAAGGGAVVIALAIGLWVLFAKKEQS